MNDETGDGVRHGVGSSSWFVAGEGGLKVFGWPRLGTNAISRRWMGAMNFSPDRNKVFMNLFSRLWHALRKMHVSGKHEMERGNFGRIDRIYLMERGDRLGRLPSRTGGSPVPPRIGWMGWSGGGLNGVARFGVRVSSELTFDDSPIRTAKTQYWQHEKNQAAEKH
jgi:hypothetical protein